MDIYDSVLTARQIREMLGVIIPEIGFVTLRRSAEIEAAYQRWLQTQCDHDEEPEIGQLITRNGQIQVQSRDRTKNINGLYEVEFEKKGATIGMNSRLIFSICRVVKYTRNIRHI